MTKHENERGRESMIDDLLTASGISRSHSPLFDCENYLFSSSHSILLEGVDFDLVYTPLKHLGYKAILNVTGPLYANGFYPHSLSVKLSLSSRFRFSQIEEIWSGMVSALREHNIEHLDLDLTPSFTGLTISLSSQGKQKKELFVQKEACKSSDLLCISGALGEAYMGLQILEREKLVFEKDNVQPELDKYKFVLQSYLSPFIDKSLFEIFSSTQILPSAGEFILNGLADSVMRVCNRNRLGAKIFMNKIPISSETSEVAAELGIDPLTAALNGGDDYRFLFAIPLEKYEALKKELPQLDIIGHLCDAGAGAMFITPDGTEIPLKAQAWDKQILNGS